MKPEPPPPPDQSENPGRQISEGDPWSVGLALLVLIVAFILAWQFFVLPMCSPNPC